jgi:hypothetical protein
VKILFDHCTPRPLRGLITGHEVRTAYEMGWADLDNGNLLKSAEAQFDLFITTDSSIRYQQNITVRKISILLIPQVLEVVRLHESEFSEAINTIQPGEYRELNW